MFGTSFAQIMKISVKCVGDSKNPTKAEDVSKCRHSSKAYLTANIKFSSLYINLAWFDKRNLSF